MRALQGGMRGELRRRRPAIAGQETGKITNGDPFDLLNTLVKMSAKRAKVDGAITATGSSDLFVQDVEDVPRHEQERLRREIDEGADATVGEMYGPPAGTERLAQQSLRPARLARPPAQRPLRPCRRPRALRRAPEALSRPRTARRPPCALLRAKLRASGDVAQEQALIETMHVAGGFAAVTSEEASTAIECAQQDAGRSEGRSAGGRGAGLRGRGADGVADGERTAGRGSRAGVAGRARQRRDAEATRRRTANAYQRRIREMVETLEAGGTRKIMSNEDGMLVPGRQQQRWRCSSCAARSRCEHLDVPALFKLGGYLKNRTRKDGLGMSTKTNGARPSRDAALAIWTESKLGAAIARLDAVDPDEQMSNEEASDFIAQFVNPEAVEARRDEFATFILEAEAFADAKLTMADAIAAQAQRILKGVARCGTKRRR